MLLKVSTLEEFKLQIDFSTSALLVFGKKPPRRKSPEKITPGKLPPGNIPPRKNNPPEK